MRVDLSSDLVGQPGNYSADLPQSQCSDNHEIQIAVGAFFTPGNGAEHKGPFYAGLFPKGLLQNVQQTTRFYNQAVNIVIEGMRLVSAKIQAIATSSFCNRSRG